jgi:hypothetical protein
MITLDVSPVTEPGTLPKAVSLELLKELTGKSDRTLVIYRRLAFSSVDEYKRSVLTRNPSYYAAVSAQWRRMDRGEKVKTLFPDSYPLTQTEARIILAISRLFDQHKLESAVTAEIEQNQDFWL